MYHVVQLIHVCRNEKVCWTLQALLQFAIAQLGQKCLEAAPALKYEPLKS